MGEEFFQSVAQLIELSETRGYSYDHIVIEASGVSRALQTLHNISSTAAVQSCATSGIKRIYNNYSVNLSVYTAFACALVLSDCCTE
jgi:hypothetical protein